MKREMSTADVWERLHAVLYESRGRWLAYVYRISKDGHVVRPYIAKCDASEDLLMILRDEFDGGDFEIIIRSGRIMRFSGRIAIVEGFATGKRRA